MSSTEGEPSPSFMDRLTEIHGRLSDLRAVWFPFFFLKPAPHEFITPARRLAMTFCFGLYTSALWGFWRFVGGDPLDLREWGRFALVSLAGFAIWFRLVTVPLWNRRASQR